ncbi:hypothetical protein O181_023175 [Austropuccinia psidii MF-1]|uniref:Uncharacterized protein n=1 Tax=Austropuccinia psidii MF-1 TaxID=1389203 RepID=A0A9Q3GYU4_9BASI|nr:hypothetical protein [Austropuccinia psidii MF-1]
MGPSPTIKIKLNSTKGPKKLKNSFAGPFVINALHGYNSVQLELSAELIKKHPDFPVSLIEPCCSSDKELFHLINIPPLEILPLEEGEEKKSCKIPERKEEKKQKRDGITWNIQKPISRRQRAT